MDIKRICDALGITQGEFAKKIGVSTQTLHNWMTGKSEPAANALREISKLYDISPVWLVTGQGPLFGHQYPAVNINLLRRIIEITERLLEMQNISLNAQQKADVISLFYDEYLKETTAGTKPEESIYETMDKTIEIALKSHRTL